MVFDKSMDITDLPREEVLQMVMIFLGDAFVHYGMWFAETFHRLGPEKTLELEKVVLSQYAPAALKRLAPHFGIEMENGIPRVLAEKSKEELLQLAADIAKTWVMGDGLWFQAVESVRGMDVAKAVNDTCWSHFAGMEAFKIRRLLGIGVGEGLEALEKALRLRIYSSINAHSASWEKDGSLVFTMNECRVQAARRRKQLKDYPCKSAGIVEYSTFAAAIDPRVKTECVWCPPDTLTEEQFCSWRFRIDGDA